ncbi:5,10-methylenetetrahydrofolate reductase (EC 1.5.1.20) [uncultured Gammaproteobacteria bacterium]|uniref:methylenetetrahydrofolate reductase [NAD(P)H] n=1 Tax=Bathymodiolus heckerae thiotrophic gill symbiont TaxID=1052212 RepID=UPI0010B7B6FA|nr:methylenetetrahydrofolate reductase [NAD(P)H] [Bathymodiolus heckerae thiotrophic gill symbiont]CAC9599539.1 5,10-methylenetetrahydrofolate reductase (EC 1.5.1.20) [uncultured Gammaproteobacteria bacterium]CAC9962506.1 5,10-methylenetetrahydrofolate reductase (EC 1.5.1.20) [uncultured Gammaproteobacteria bacterium]SHN90149.1 5,10-methylenetetrahydrofolate reductase [Bathymodiolus heckerae thiotrophic gill symbiont]
MQLSFEFFPPRTDQGKQNLREVRQQLSIIKPHYFSTTFGAGGTTQDATLETVLDIQANDGIPAAPHLSCIDSEKSKILTLLNQYKNAGINRIVALRGDIPSGVRDIGDFHYANELVEFIREEFNDHFHIEVAAYPEMHPQAKNMQTDITHFVNKINAGANSAITQYFYNTDAYFRFVDEVQKQGIDVPITPGIMPITNYDQLLRFSNMCGAEIPRWIEKRLATYGDDMQSLREFGFDVVANLCDQLKTQGVESFHFYSMNKSQPSLKLAQSLI